MSRIAFAVLALAIATLPALAVDDKPLSFAFASQAGSGIYDIEGRVVQIYRIPISFTARELDEDRIWGASVTLPVTFGFYDYTATDVLGGQLPSHIGTASLLPGVKFDVRAMKNWILSPRVDLGAAKDVSGGALVWVYDVGLLSIVSFPAGSWDARAGQELLWAGAAQTGNALTDWYGQAKVGFEFRHELPWSSGRSQWDLGLFVVYDRFFKDKGSSSDAVTYGSPAATPGVDEQTEIGFSFGTRPPVDWKKWKAIYLPKLGLSYRFGDGVQGVRLVIGEIF